MGFLTEKVAEVRSELERSPLDDSVNMARVLASPPARDFASALRARTPAIIAEVKHASPSAGAIASARDASGQARAYSKAGAAAISVLTDERDFGGSLADLRAVRVVTDLPVLRKDFLVHPSQLIESRAAGADAVLLIAACLSEPELRALIAAGRDLGLGVLVETHSADDLDKALSVEAGVIGVNARDLESFEVDVGRALEQLRRVPSDRIAVMESGVTTRDLIVAAVRAGASAILVGEALMRAADPEMKLRELLGEDGT